MTRYFLRGAPGLGLLSLTLLLAGCGEDKPDSDFSLSDQAWSNAFANESALPPLPDAQPMAVAEARAPVAAPRAERLPAAAPVRYAQPQGDSYAWIDRADMFSDALGDAPPDYGFAYDDGVTPWAWQSRDDYLRYAEPVEGGYRYYYYEPGGASPYLVRDPWNSYGYRGDALVAVYDRGGRVIPWREARGREAYAARYYERAVDMRRAARARERERIEARQWAARRAAIRDDRLRWDAARERQADWRRYRARQEVRAQQQHWATERRARKQAATRFARWQHEDFRGPQPLLQREQQRRQVRAQQMAQREQRRDQWEREQRAEARQDAAERRVALMQRQAEQRADQRRAVVRAEQRRVAVDQAAPRRAAQRRAQAERARADDARTQALQTRQRVEQARVEERRAMQRRQTERQHLAAQRAQHRQAAAQQAAARQARRQEQAHEQRAQQARQQRAERQQVRAHEAKQARAARQEQALAVRQQAVAQQRVIQRQEQAQQRAAARQAERARRIARADGPGRSRRSEN